MMISDYACNELAAVEFVYRIPVHGFITPSLGLSYSTFIFCDSGQNVGNGYGYR